MVSRGATGEISHHAFTELPGLLLPGDLIVVNTSATLPAAVRLAGAADRAGRPAGLAVHFSTPLPDGDWLVELRRRAEGGTTVSPIAAGARARSSICPAGPC